MSQPPRPSRSREIDQATREGDLDLQTLRTAIPPELMRPNEWRSWLTLLRVLLMVGLCLLALSQITLTRDASLVWKLPALVLVWGIYAPVLLGFFLVGHDCGHGSFSRFPRVNRWVGNLCMAPIFNGFRTWTLTHNHHHQFTQIRGEDVDWSSHLVTAEEYKTLRWRKDFAIKVGYAIPFGIFWWILWNAMQRGSQVKPMLQPSVYERNRGRLRASNLLMWGTTLAIYTAFWRYTGLWGLLKYHHIPVSLASLLGGIMVSVGHANFNALWYDRESWSPLRGQVVSTYDYRFPKWLEYLVLNINIHIPHHVSVRIPWYNLKPAAQALKKAHPEIYQELPFRSREMAWIIRAPFIHHDPEQGTYQMVRRERVA